MPSIKFTHIFYYAQVLLIFLLFKSSSLVTAITFEEISSLANKDPNNHKSLIFRQIEINWINAPLEDSGDYLALYLDNEPERSDQLPVSVHKVNKRLNGKIITDYYLPLINFSNLTTRTSSQNYDASQLDAQALESENNNRLGEYNQLNNQLKTIYTRSSIDSPIHIEDETRWRRHSIGLARGGAGEVATNGQHFMVDGRDDGIVSPLVDECIGYCVAYHSGNRILASNCLKTNPNWMQNSFSTIGARSLPSLMIPGTHNSATYPRLLDKSVLQMINKYQMNQDECIFNQLVFGIRYLDLRVGFSKVKQRNERLWVYHDIFRTEVSAEEVFEQVKRFLDMTTHEIIIMDFHRFTVGFQNENTQTQRERHAKLIELIFKHLGQYVIPSYLGQHAPIQEYIALGKRLIIGYAGRAQLLGTQSADQHHSIFGLYLAGADHKQPTTGDERQPMGTVAKLSPMVRDIDAIKQDLEDQLGGELSSKNYTGRYQQALERQLDASEPISIQDSVMDNQTDGRMGTRIYNKLKSLKLISHSFSKRSASPVSTKSDSSPDNDNLSSTTSPKVNNTLTGRKLLGKLILAREPLITAPEAPTPGDISSSVAKAALFFPPVRHLWPNKDTLEGLAQYMNETTCRKYFGELRSMMVELTPTVFGAISDKYDGNRKLAQQVNRPVTDWIRDRWLHCINIVASDFYLGNDMIRLSMYANRMRVTNRVDPSSQPFSVSCKSKPLCSRFRKIEHLVNKAKIPIQFAYQPLSGHDSSHVGHELEAGLPTMGTNSVYRDEELIVHHSPSGHKIILRPLLAATNLYSSTNLPSAGGSGVSFGSGGQPQSRERRDSFVDNVSDGLADFLSSFKRLFNF